MTSCLISFQLKMASNSIFLTQDILEWYHDNLKELLIRGFTVNRKVLVFFYQPVHLDDYRLILSENFGDKFKWVPWPLSNQPFTEEDADYVFKLLGSYYSYSSLRQQDKTLALFPIVLDSDYRTRSIVRLLVSDFPDNISFATHCSLISKLQPVFPTIEILDYRFFCPPMEPAKDINHGFGFFSQKRRRTPNYVDYAFSEMIMNDISMLENKALHKLTTVDTYSDLEVVAFLRHPDKLQDFVVKGRTNYKYAKAVQDIVMQNLTYNPRKKMAVLAAQNQLFANLEELADVGDSSASVVQVPQVDFLVKEDSPEYLKDPLTSAGNMVHEAFVGLMGTNILRSQIPNFAYIYGVINCKLRPNLLDLPKGWQLPGEQNRKQSYRCRDDVNAGTVVIYEKITNSTSFNKFMETHSEEDSLAVFIQVVLALIHANSVCGFIHGDLHGDNILVKKLDQPITVKYTLPYTGDFYITSRHIPVFIDYGFAQIVYKGRPHVSNHPSILNTASQYPLLDVYKLALNMSAVLYGSTVPLIVPFPGVASQVKAFSKTTDYAILNPYEKFAVLSTEDYLWYTRKLYPKIFAELENPNIKTKLFGVDDVKNEVVDDEMKDELP